MLCKKILVAGSVALSLLSSSAYATFIQNTTGLTGTFSTETFDTSGAVSGTLAAGQFSGVTFGQNMYVSNEYASAFFPNISGNSIADFYDAYRNCCLATPASFSFSAPVTAVAFSYSSNDGTSTFSAYLGGTLVESFSANTDTYMQNNYYGFTGIVFDSIQILAPFNNAFVIDNLQVTSAPATVPEPASLALLGLGLAGLVGRRKAKQA